MHLAIPHHPRDPTATILYGCVSRHWPCVGVQVGRWGHSLPSFVHREFESYLKCGILDYGLARIHCHGCGHDRLVAFSCKGRGFCPSCGGRRMVEGATWLCERVLPAVPLRQWVITLPRGLRYLLAYNGKLLRAVSRTAILEVFRFLRLKARRVLGLASTRLALPGSMVAVQRFGSSLNLNVHFHALVLDGVYVPDAFGTLAFLELAPPSLEDLNHVVARIATSVLALLHRKGIWLEDAEDDPVAERNPSLAALAQSAIRGTLVFGPAGAKPACLKNGPIREPDHVERVGRALGFTLDAEVRVSAHNRLHRERLCRYLLRPPLAKGRLHETTDGKYALELKTPWSDGTRVIFFHGDELVARLAALVPPPRMHQVHYFGILAPNAKLRRYVVPEAPDDRDSDPCGHAMVYEEKRSGPTVRRRWIPWRTLLLRVFGVDAMKCPGCGSQMQRIAVILQPKVIKSILDCLNGHGRSP